MDSEEKTIETISADQPDIDVINKLRALFEKAPDDIDTALRLASMYVNSGWYNQAKDVFRDALKVHADDFTLLIEYGNTCFKKGEFSEAGTAFKRLTEIRPDKIEAWNNLGIVELHLGDLDAAQSCFEKVIEIEPENAGALLNMGNYYFGKERYEDASTYFKKAVDVMPGFSDAWYNLGNTMLKLERLDAAIESFDKALKYKINFPSALKNLGFVYERQKKLDDAQRCYSKAIELNKADPALRINLGGIYLLQDKFDEAKECFLKAVRLAPQEVGGWMGLREVALIKGDLQTFSRATLAVLPKLNESLIADSIEILLDLDQKNAADELVQQIDRLGINGDLLDAQRICLYFLRDGNNAKIQSILTRLLAKNTTDQHILKGLARYSFLSGKFEQVVELVNKIDKPDSFAQCILWRSLIKSDKDTQARRLIQNYIKDYPQSFECWYLLALIEAKKGNRQRAEKFLIKALENGYSNLDELQKEPLFKEIMDSIEKNPGSDSETDKNAEQTGNAGGKQVVL
jgi:tetratricopeptide (TPR) repeat protein